MLQNMAADLNVPLTEDLLALDSNEEISAALVQKALESG
jgi:hypothetical protein